MRIKLIFLLALCFGFFTKQDVVARDRQSEIPILAWYSIPPGEYATEERYRELKDCGFNYSFSQIYTKKDATEGEVIIGTKEAVTIFNKKGTVIEQERDANTRENVIYSRKYYVVALTDETKAVKLKLAA